VIESAEHPARGVFRIPMSFGVTASATLLRYLRRLSNLRKKKVARRADAFSWTGGCHQEIV
jgi:hypothetical protein